MDRRGPVASRNSAAPVLALLLGALHTPLVLAERARWLPATEAVITQDLLWNLSGGLQQDGRQITNAHLGLAWDLPVASGGRQEVFVNLLHNTGETFSADVVGDAQVVSNIEAGEITRAMEAWWRYFSDTEDFSLLVGLWDLNAEIDVVEPAGLFLNSSHGIGFDFSQSGENGPSIFPVTALSLYATQALGDDTKLRLAALDAVPGDPADPDGTDVHLSSEEGALLVAEIEHVLDRGVTLKAGSWRYTQKFERTDGRGEQGGSGLYGAAWGAVGPIQVFLRAGVATDAIHPADAYLGAGIVWPQAIPSLTGSSAGVAVAHASASDALQGLGRDSHETTYEITADLPLANWLRIQPNLQYVVNPGFDPTLDDALVAGFRVELLFASQ